LLKYAGHIFAITTMNYAKNAVNKTKNIKKHIWNLKKQWMKHWE